MSCAPCGGASVLAARKSAQMPVHVAAEVHARHHLLPDVAALRVRDRVELVEVRFLRNRRCRRCRFPIRGARPRRARSPTLRAPPASRRHPRRAPTAVKRSRLERTARILRRRGPATRAIVTRAPSIVACHVRVRRERRRARRRLTPVIADTMLPRLDAEDADVPHRVRVVAIARRSADSRTSSPSPSKPGHARGGRVDEIRAVAGEHAHVGDDLSLRRKRGGVAALARLQRRRRRSSPAR